MSCLDFYFYLTELRQYYLDVPQFYKAFVDVTGNSHFSTYDSILLEVRSTR